MTVFEMICMSLVLITISAAYVIFKEKSGK
jgi:hypothetical protein